MRARWAPGVTDVPPAGDGHRLTAVEMSRTRELGIMSKRGNKRRARKKKGANHGKRPNA